MTREEFERLEVGDWVRDRGSQYGHSCSTVSRIDREAGKALIQRPTHDYQSVYVWADYGCLDLEQDKHSHDVLEPEPKETPGSTGMDYDKLLAGGFSKLDRITHTVYFIQTTSFGPSTQIEVVVVADRYLVQLVDYDRDYVCTFQGIDTIEDMAALLDMFKVYHELDCADSPQEGE